MVRLPQAGRGSDPPSNPAVLLRQLGKTELEVPEARVTERGLGIRPIFYFFRDREASTITVVKLSRSSGVVLHPTSLPGPYGIGDLGPEAYRFARFVSSSGLGVWQVLPLGPPGFGDSPYQCFSAFAGNPLLISPDLLAQDALLDKADLEERPDFDPARVDFRAVIDFKLPLLERAYRNFKAAAGNQTGSEFKVFLPKLLHLAGRLRTFSSGQGVAPGCSLDRLGRSHPPARSCLAGAVEGEALGPNPDALFLAIPVF